jgi:hypothetical protein
MSSTFTSPIRIFVRNNPTNDGTIAADNTGASSAAQQVSFSGVNAAGAITTYGIGNQSTTADSVVVPAGSMITNVRLFETTAPSAFTGMVITVASGGVTIGTITPNTTGGVIAMTAASTTTGASAMANVGTSDVTLTFTVGSTSGVTGTLAGVFDVTYVPRNLDGSISPYGSGYTNS